MQEDSINFEEISKDETAHADQSSPLFKQPIRGRYENLHAELKARCAPENFMNPYEPEKVSRANELYAEVLSINVQADEKLKLLRLRAMEELGVKFSTEQLFEKLSAACNPKNFTGDSYNKERLELANELYQQILMNADNIFALEEIEVKAKGLIEVYNPHQYGSGTLRTDNKDDLSEASLVALLFIIIVAILVIAGVSINSR
jgi:hypothetical protein